MRVLDLLPGVNTTDVASLWWAPNQVVVLRNYNYGGRRPASYWVGVCRWESYVHPLPILFGVFTTTTTF